MARDLSGETGSHSLPRTLRTALALGLLALWGVAGGAGAGEVELVSAVHPSQVSGTGAGAEHLNDPIEPPGAGFPLISADGRYAVFLSTATNLAPGQDESRSAGSATRDVFLHDLATGTTDLVRPPAASPGLLEVSTAAALSADGRYVAFVREGFDPAAYPRSVGLFLYDRTSGSAALVASPTSEEVFFTSPVLSANGRYLAFVSNAQDLVPGQQDEDRSSRDVFLYDRVEKKIRLVSHVSGSASTAGDGQSGNPVLSADGRYIAFLSDSDLIPGQPRASNVFLYDRTADALTLIGPGTPPVMSADGRYVALGTPLGLSLYDRVSRTTMRIAPPEESSSSPSHRPAISADGRFVAFISSADNLVPGQEGDTQLGLFLHDRATQRTILVSRRNDSPTRPGAPAATPSISGDGRYVAFASGDPGMVPGQTDANGSTDVFLFDRSSGKVALVSSVSDSSSTAGDAASYAPVLSANGARLVFLSGAGDLVAKDLNQGVDVFAYRTASREKVSVSARAPEMPSFSSAHPSLAQDLSADGRFVAFESESPSLIAGQVDTNGRTDVFLYDRMARTTALVSRSAVSATKAGNGHSALPSLSADGRYIAFASNATDLVEGGSHGGGSYQVFLHDRNTGRTVLVGRSNVSSPFAAGVRISADGRYVAFTSDAGDVIPGQQEQNPDGQATFDVFLHDRVTGGTLLVSRSKDGPLVTGNGTSALPELSADGRYVAFLSGATDLVSGQIDERDSGDVFLFDRVAGSMALVSHVPGSALTAAGGSFRSDPLSSDGQFVLFSGDIEDLAPGSGAEGFGVFVYDRSRGAHALIARRIFSTPFEISADGRYVAFMSNDDLTPGIPRGFFLYDRVAETFSPVGRRPNGLVESLALSADGRSVAYATTTGGGGNNVYLFDRISGTETLLSAAAPPVLGGREESGQVLISAGGQQVAFTSSVALAEADLNLLPDVYLFDSGPASNGPIPLPLCTLLDTRRAADGPALRSKSRRVLQVHGACGVPARAKSVSVKVTVHQPAGRGNLQLYPGDSTTARSGILRFERQQTRSGSFTLPLATNGAGTLAILPTVSGNGTVHVVVEVNGYVE